MYHRWLIVAAAALLWTGCRSVIDPVPDARHVEFVYQDELGGAKMDKCSELAEFDIVATPYEKTSSTKHTVAEVKARNRAATLDATHLLLWPSEIYPCDRHGERLPNERLSDQPPMCTRLPATAYRCLVGRGDW